MSDEQVEVKEQEIEQIEQVQEDVEQPQEHREEETTTPQPKRKDAEYNFSQLRREKDAADRRAQDAERRYNDILELSKQLKSTHSPEQRDVLEEELAKLSNDDLATVGNVDKMYSKREKGTKKEVDGLKKELNEIKAQVEEQRLRARYPDLDDVITDENIQLLRDEDPEIAEMLGRMPQGSKEQAILAYKYIKRLIPAKTPVTMERKKAIENSKKPMSVQAVSKQSAIGSAHMFENGLTPDIKKQLWQEMQDAMKRG